MQVPTTDQLRDRIDKGLTGDKVAVTDPAAAPLGTDAEAGGTPPTAHERALDAAQSPGPVGDARASVPAPLIYICLVLLVAAAFAAIVLLASR